MLINSFFFGDEDIDGKNFLDTLYSPSGKIVIVYQDSTIRVVDFKDKGVITPIDSEESAFSCKGVIYSEPHELLSFYDNSVINFLDRKCLKTAKESIDVESSIVQMEVSPNGKFLAVLIDSFEILVYDFLTAEKLFTIKIDPKEENPVFAIGNNSLVSGGHLKFLNLWDLENKGKLKKKLYVKLLILSVQ